MITKLPIMKIFSLTLLIRLFYVFSGFAISILLAKILPIESFGLYTLALTVGSVLSVCLQFGWSHLLVRESALAFTNKQWQFVKPIVSGAYLWLSKNFVLAALLIFVAFSYLGFLTQLSLFVVALSVFLALVLALNEFRCALLKGAQQVVLSQLSESVLRPVFFILLCSYLYLFNCSISYEWLVAAYVFFTACAFAIVFIISHYSLPSFSGNVSDKQMKVELPVFFGLNNILQVVSSHIGIFVVSGLLSSENVALLKVALLFSGVVAILIQVIDMVLIPKLSELVSQGHKHQLLGFLKRLMVPLSLLSLFVFVMYYFFGEYVLVSFYGVDYQSAYVPLLILALGQLVNVSTGPIGSVMMLLKKEKAMLKITFFAFILNFILQISLVPFTGLIGAAVASSLALIYWNLAFLYNILNDL